MTGSGKAMLPPVWWHLCRANVTPLCPQVPRGLHGAVMPAMCCQL